MSEAELGTQLPDQCRKQLFPAGLPGWLLIAKRFLTMFHCVTMFHIESVAFHPDHCVAKGSIYPILPPTLLPTLPAESKLRT